MAGKLTLGFAITVLIAASLDTGCSKTPLAAEPPYGSDDTAFSFVLGTGSYPIPLGTLPAKGEPFFDPRFHTKIARITQSSDPYEGPGIENEYARSDPENADGSLLILRGNSGNWYLYDAVTYKRVRQLTVFSDGSQEPEPRWDASNPAMLYYLSNMELRRYDVRTEKIDTVHDFGAEFAGASTITTGTEGDASADRRNCGSVRRNQLEGDADLFRIELAQIRGRLFRCLCGASSS